MKMNVPNLLKLAEFLDNLPENYPNFNMGEWVWSDNDSNALAIDELDSVSISECGYVACAVGHAPQALGLTTSELEGMDDWLTFINKYLEVTPDEQAWLFSDQWETLDNTHKGVAKRIRYTIENGAFEDIENYKGDLREVYSDY